MYAVNEAMVTMIMCWRVRLGISNRSITSFNHYKSKQLHGKSVQKPQSLFIALLLLVIWGFYRTYFNLFPSFTGIQPVQHFHGIMMLSWFAMLIIQPLLIRYEKFALHRKVGALSYIIIPLLLFSIFLVARMGFTAMQPG